MCLPPRETNNDVAHESARRRGVPAGQHGSRRLPTHSSSGNTTRLVDHNGLPRVSFQHKDDNVVHYIPTALSMLLVSATNNNNSNDTTNNTTTNTKTLSMEERRRQLWYNRTDMQEFRRQAQTISQRMRRNSQQQDDSDDSDDEDEQEEDTRGLEVRMSFSRQDHKHLIVRRILQAQQDDSTPEEIAQISQQHSIWSRKLALAQAHKDYCAVYHPHLTSLSKVPLEMPSMLNCHRDVVRSNNNITTNCSKRSLLMMRTSLEQPGRRVRCRMY